MVYLCRPKPDADSSGGDKETEATRRRRAAEARVAEVREEWEMAAAAKRWRRRWG